MLAAVLALVLAFSSWSPASAAWAETANPETSVELGMSDEGAEAIEGVSEELVSAEPEDVIAVAPQSEEGVEIMPLFDFNLSTGLTVSNLRAESTMHTSALYDITFDYKIIVSSGIIQANDTITINTNFGTLFEMTSEAQAALTNMPVYYGATQIGAFTISGNTVVVTFNAAAQSMNLTAIEGSISTGLRMKPRIALASEAGTAQTVTVGDQSAATVFKSPGTGSGGGIKELDWADIWKNTGSGTTSNNSVIYVNPEATNILVRNLGTSIIREPSGKNMAKGNVFLEDTIPGKGVIDESDFNIHAVRPVPVYDDDGNLCAKEAGSQWQPLQNTHFTKLTPAGSDTYASFRAKVAAQTRSYGFFTDSEGNQSFFINFGSLPGNGITYKSLYGDLSGNNAVFNTDNAVDGQILSYAVAYKTDYPSITFGKHQLTNTATMNYLDGGTTAKETVRTPSFIIAPGGASGVGTSGTLTIWKYDEKSVTDNPSTPASWIPLQGVQFAVEKSDGAGGWVSHATGTTDSNGFLRFSALNDADYRLVETQAILPYDENSATWITMSDSQGMLDSSGEFSIKSSDLVGYGVYILNAKKQHTVSWAAGAGGTISPASPTESVVSGGNASKVVTATPATAQETATFAGWYYRYLPEGAADVPANYLSGTVADYKTVEIKGDVTFTAVFSKALEVSVSATNGYAAIAKGATAPGISGSPKPSTGSVSYASAAAAGESVAIKLEAQTHYAAAKITVSDLYGNTKIIYTTKSGETADSSIVMNDSTLNVTLSASPATSATLLISNIKNSLNIVVEYEGDPTYTVNFYAVSGDTTPYGSNGGLFAGDPQGAAPATNPTRSGGWTFQGWSYDGTSANPYNATTLITNADVNVYGIWSANNYTVNYNLAGGTIGGSSTLANKSVTFDETGLLPTGTMAKTGYTFTSWTSGATTISGTTKYSDLVANDTVSSVTLTAGWEAHEFSVAFDKNSSVATGTMANQDFVYGVSQALTQNAFDRQGYSFAGWSTSATGAVEYANQQSVQNLSSVDGDTITLYAIWNANGDTAYAIEHYQQQVDGSYVLAETDNLSGTTDATVYSTPRSDTQSGWEDYSHFADHGDTVDSGLVASDGSLVLKAYYKRIETVSFDTAGGEPSFNAQRVIKGDLATHPGAPSKPGYTFTGWSYDDNGSEDIWDFTASVENTMTLTAAYRANKYTVVFDKGAAGATGTMADQIFDFGTAQNLTANGFSYQGHKFLGWATTPDGQVEYVDEQSVIDLTEVDEDIITLYAQWEDVPEAISGTEGANNKSMPQTSDGLFSAVKFISILILAAVALGFVAWRRKRVFEQ